MKVMMEFEQVAGGKDDRAEAFAFETLAVWVGRRLKKPFTEFPVRYAVRNLKPTEEGKPVEVDTGYQMSILSVA